jgi:putative Mg2+ transporter-C (MgtC) family protein
MQAIDNINLVSLMDTLASLGTAFVLGSLIGFERQFRQRTAGLRTNVLVALGAAMFVDTASRLYGAEGAIRVIAYVVSGIGFLGAGVIMREGGNVRGINTAATLWCSGAVGACAGSDLILEACVATGFVLAANTLLRPVVDRINRLPFDARSAEVTHTVYVVTKIAAQKEVLALVEQAFEKIDCPIRELDVFAFGEDHVKIQAILGATRIEAAALDAMLERLQALPQVAQAYSSASTQE